VRWEAGIRSLLDHGFTRFVELGPGKALTGFMRRIDRTATTHNVADVSSLEATVNALSG
jgi:[acyl-carrier-protein] S-malonyltransferase